MAIQERRRTPEELASQHGIDLSQELVRGFAGRYIRRKAQQLVGKARLAEGDREDIEQHLRIALIESLERFDPARSHWQAFVLAVVDRQVASLLRVARTKKRKHRENLLSLSCEVSGEEGLPVELGDTLLPKHQEFLVGAILNDHQSAFALEDDMAAVIAKLPVKLQLLCELRQKNSVSDIAMLLDVPRSTVDYWYGKIAAAFRKADLEKYLEVDS